MMAGLFIIMGIVVGLIAGLKTTEICDGFNEGFRDVLPHCPLPDAAPVLPTRCTGCHSPLLCEQACPLTGRHEPLRAELKTGDLLPQTTSPSRKATPSMLIRIVQLKTIAMRSTE